MPLPGICLTVTPEGSDGGTPLNPASFSVVDPTIIPNLRVWQWGKELVSGLWIFKKNQRNTIPFNTKRWGSAAMLDAPSDPLYMKRVLIPEDGQYDAFIGAPFMTATTENIANLGLNGYDARGSHTGGNPPTDGEWDFTTYPNGVVIMSRGNTTAPVTRLIEGGRPFNLKKGDFLFVHIQSDADFQMELTDDPHVVKDYMYFVVQKRPALAA